MDKLSCELQNVRNNILQRAVSPLTCYDHNVSEILNGSDWIYFWSLVQKFLVWFPYSSSTNVLSYRDEKKVR